MWKFRCETCRKVFFPDFIIIYLHIMHMKVLSQKSHLKFHELCKWKCYLKNHIWSFTNFLWSVIKCSFCDKCINSHLQKNLLTKSRTRERQTKSTWNNLFLKLITYICNKVHFFSGSNLWSSNLVSSFFWSSNLVGSFLWSSKLVIGLKKWSFKKKIDEDNQLKCFFSQFQMMSIIKVLNERKVLKIERK